MEHFPIIDRLHTDVLEDKYGPISAKVIKHTKFIRESHLIDDEGISRTYALTFLTPRLWTDKIKKINNKIKAGGAIGKEFRKEGYSIRKNVIDVWVMEVPYWLKKKFNHKGSHAKARLSEFYAKAKGKPVIYGVVVEIYSPDFRPPLVNKYDIVQINPSTEEFSVVGVSIGEIWKRLRDGNDWSDLQNKYSFAKEKSLKYVFNFKEKIISYMDKKN